MKRLLFCVAFALSLNACGGDGATVGSSSTAEVLASPVSPALATTVATPTPTPINTPTPNPTNPPSPERVSGDGKIVVVSEGSSSAVDYPSSHTGLYAASLRGAEWHGMAVGGSSLETMTARRDAVLAAKPDLVSIYIGSNDIAIQSKYPTVDTFIGKLKEYVDPLRATGTRVVVCTILPKQPSIAGDTRFNTIRREFNEKIKKVDWIDGIADFGGHPVVGPDEAPYNMLYYQLDGQHLTSLGQATIYVLYKESMDKLIADVR